MNIPAIPRPGCDPSGDGGRVLAGLQRVSPPEILGAHDADFVIINGRAWIVYMANPSRQGESPDWPDVACDLAIVGLSDRRVERIVRIAGSEQTFGDQRLPHGACFVPRLVRRDTQTLRCFFASEDPGRRESQTYHVDIDIATATVGRQLHKTLLHSVAGDEPMCPSAFHRHGVRSGFQRPYCAYGLFMVDGVKSLDGRRIAVLNGYNTGQLAVAELDAKMERFTILGDIPGGDLRLSEAAVNRLPDGSWLLIARHDGGDGNYRFATSPDGCIWTEPQPLGLVQDGIASKPTLDRHGAIYALGWNAATRIDGATRSVFHLDVSRDGRHWHRRFTFACRDSFQYPVFRASDGEVWVVVTQGPITSDCHSGKQRIMFGRLATIDELD